MSAIQPIDVEIIVRSAEETAGIVTVEDHSVYGGLGGAVAEVVATECPTKMRIIGVRNEFAPTGPVEWLFEYFGLTAENIRDKALEILG